MAFYYTGNARDYRAVATLQTVFEVPTLVRFVTTWHPINGYHGDQVFVDRGGLVTQGAQSAPVVRCMQYNRASLKRRSRGGAGRDGASWEGAGAAKVACAHIERFIIGVRELL